MSDDDPLNDCQCAGCAGEWYCALHPRVVTTPSPTAREIADCDRHEAAAMKLAKWLHEEAFRAATLGEFTERDAREGAREILREIGAVIPDPALLQAVREAKGCYTDCRGCVDSMDADTLCPKCEAELALGRHVAEQLEPKP